MLSTADRRAFFPQVLAVPRVESRLLDARRRDSMSRLTVWQSIWGTKNLYVVDGSVFPTSVGENPMQSNYTFAKILADRMAEGRAAGQPAQGQPN
jgi:hypothetical protein